MKFKKLIISTVIIIVSLLFIVSCMPTGLTLNEAIQKVKDDILGTVNYNLIMFGPNASFGANTTITELFRATPIILAAESYIFWIDYHPGARYEHSSKIIIVNKKTGMYTQYDWNYWPIIDGVDYWKDRTEYWDSSNWLYSNFVEPVIPLDYAPSPSFINISFEFDKALKDGEAAIVARGDNGTDFQHDETNMKSFYDGQGIPVDTVHPTDGASGIVNAINTAAASSAVQDITLYFTGHGGKTAGGEPYVVVGGTQLTATQLKNAIAAHPTKTFKIIIDACYSGAFIDYLDDLSNVVCVHTAASATGYCYDDIDKKDSDGEWIDPNPEDQGGEWTSGFHEDLLEIVVDELLMMLIETEAELMEVPVIAVLYDYAKDSAREKDAAAINGWSDPQDYNSWITVPD